MEQFPTPQERRKRVDEFVKSQKLSIPILFDRADEVFHAFGSPGLRSLVIFTPRGTIYQYHQGITSNFLEALKLDVQKAATAP